MNASGYGNQTLREQLEDAVGEFVPGPVHVRAPPPNGSKPRFTEILHNFCHEPLPWYKNLEHIRPDWPTQMRKFTVKDGFRVADHHNIQVAARDQLQRTKKGKLRTSTGLVTYSSTHRMEFELDAQDLIKILREKEPQTRHGKFWSVKALEKAYQFRFRKHGSWARQGVSFKVYLSLFPKTFDLFGADSDYVRVACKSRLCAVDDSQDAMVSLALACEQGFVERTAPLEGTMKAGQECRRLPEIAQVRTRSLFRSTSDPGLRSHTLPVIKESQDLLDASFKLPTLRASTLPALVPRRPDIGESADGGGSLASTMRLSDIDDARSTFRVSFMVDREDRASGDGWE
jgi:hypothetical protein